MVSAAEPNPRGRPVRIWWPESGACVWSMRSNSSVLTAASPNSSVLDTPGIRRYLVTGYFAHWLQYENDAIEGTVVDASRAYAPARPV